VLPDGRTALTIEQGGEVGRPSRLEVRVEAGSAGAVETVVRGGVRMVAKGELLALPE